LDAPYLTLKPKPFSRRIKTMEVIKLNAGNDTNGNPRRLFVAIKDTEIVGAWDEGYEGPAAVPQELKSLAVRAPTFLVRPSEYKDILRQFRRHSQSWEPAAVLAIKAKRGSERV
jgi:hypothetical protein